MKALSIADADTAILGLQDEIRRTNESRYDHRLHGLLLVAQGLSALEVSGLLGDAPRTVQYWVRRYNQDGLPGLQEEQRPGRPRRLSEEQIQQVNVALRRSPEECGLKGNLWDGKTLSAWIDRQFGVSLGVRQCQYLFRELDFRLRKPRPLIAKADPARQEEHKKNSKP